MEKQHAEIKITQERRKYAAGLVIAIAAVTAFVSLIMGSETSFAYYDVLRIGSIGSAVLLSFVVFAKQGSKGLFGRAYTALAAGLAMWLVAESIWGYYELVLGIETPFPSIADAFFLGAYAGLLYYVFSLYKFFGKGIKRYAVVGVTAGIAIFAFFYLESLISVSVLPEGETEEDFALPLVISVAYPVLDLILLVPAILIVLNSGKGLLTSIPWIFVSFILTAIADILLGYSAVTGFQSDGALITMIYIAAYFCMTTGLLWYLRFFISGQRQAFKS